MIYDMTQEISNQKNIINLMADFSMEVTDDKGGYKFITGAYKNFKMNMDMGVIKIEIDSDKQAESFSLETIRENPGPMYNKLFSGIKGKKFIMQVDGKGNVHAIQGFDEIVRSMVDSMGLGEEFSMQLTASLKDQFSPAKIKEQFSPVFTIYPDKEVRIGDSRERTYETMGPAASKFTTQFTLKSAEAERYQLTAVSRIEPAGEIKMNGTQKGTLVVDRRTGLVLTSELTMDAKATTENMNMTITARGMIKGRVRD
jgi:hypothetical protein